MTHKRFIMALAVALILIGCYGASHLRTSFLDNPKEIQGTFNVVFYGARYADDPGSLVVLDVAGDGYKLVPQAIEGSFKIAEGLAADEALEKGIKFLKQNKYYDGVDYHAIHALDGGVIGYEMMPEYEHFTYVSRRTVSVNYFMGDDGIVNFRVHERVRFENDIKVENKFNKKM